MAAWLPRSRTSCPAHPGSDRCQQRARAKLSSSSRAREVAEVVEEVAALEGQGLPPPGWIPLRALGRQTRGAQVLRDDVEILV